MDQEKFKKQMHETVHPTNSLLSDQWNTFGICEQCLMNGKCPKRCNARLQFFQDMIAKKLLETGVKFPPMTGGIIQ